MNTSNIRPRRTRGLPAAVLTCAAGALLSGCGLFGGGGGGAAPSEIVPPPATAAESEQIAAVNRRILAARPAGAEPGAASGYRVGPSDLIAINVFGAETFSGEYRVEESGHIALPLVGAVEVAGHTPRELEEVVASRLRDTYMRDPHVTIQVLEVQSQGVSVMGAVSMPGVYQIPGRARLLEVLAMAQGLSEDAGRRVAVVRPVRSGGASPVGDTGVAEGMTPPTPDAPGAAIDPASRADLAALGVPDAEIIEVDLVALLEQGQTRQNIEVLPGDIVQVSPAGLVYVVGEVNRPGGFTMPAGAPLSALQALAMAEGLGRTARASEAVIVREHEDGRREEIPVDLEEVLDGEAPPPQLEARDVLFVPNNGTKAFALGVVNALVSMVTLRGLFY